MESYEYLIHGYQIRNAQLLLRENDYGVFYEGEPTYDYSKKMAYAVWRAKVALGYPKSQINYLYDHRLREFLLRKRELPVTYRFRRNRRVRLDEGEM